LAGPVAAGEEQSPVILQSRQNFKDDGDIAETKKPEQVRL
jgi:hypothetical protein